MIRQKLFSLIHPVHFRHYLLKDCWGFISQEQLFYHKKKDCYSRMMHPDLETRKKFNLNEFKIGVKQGYKMVYKSFYQKENFLHKNFTTPKLSLALNHLQKNLKHEDPILNFNNLSIHILHSNVEYGLVKSNDKILGLWTPSCIKKDILTGMIGPEFQTSWNQQPIRQTVIVLYQFDNRRDIWTWQRSLSTPQRNWVIYNINNILNN